MRSSSAGFLLLILGVLGLIGFLTGNLDRWLAYLFTPAGGQAAVSVAPAATGTTASATANRRSA